MSFQRWRVEDPYTYYQFNSAHDDASTLESPRILDAGYTDHGCTRTLRFIMTESTAKRLTSKADSEAKTADLKAFEDEVPGNFMLQGMIRKFFEGADVNGCDFKEYESELYDSANWNWGRQMSGISSRDASGKVTLTFKMSGENEKLPDDVLASFLKHSKVSAKGGLYASLVSLPGSLVKTLSQYLGHVG